MQVDERPAFDWEWQDQIRGIPPAHVIRLLPKQAHFCLPAPALALLGYPSHIRLGVDLQHRAFCVVGCDAEAPGARRLTSRGKRARSAMVTGRGGMRKLDVTESLRLPWEVVGTMLVVRLPAVTKIAPGSPPALAVGRNGAARSAPTRCVE